VVIFQLQEYENEDRRIFNFIEEFYKANYSKSEINQSAAKENIQFSFSKFNNDLNNLFILNNLDTSTAEVLESEVDVILSYY